MTQNYVGEIRPFAGTFAPVDWHLCDGSLLSIPNYSTLYNLIGTTYGGDGVNTFALPATALPGRLASATEAIAAASYCSGPSIARSGSSS